MLEVQLDAERRTDVDGFVDVPDGPHRLSVRHGTTGWLHSWRLVTGGCLLFPEAGGTDLAGPRGGPAALPATPVAAGAPGRDTRARPQLAPYPPASAARWGALTANLRHHPEVVELGRSGGRRGGSGALAAEVERRFIEGFLTPDRGEPGAILRWRQLLGAVAATRVATGSAAERAEVAELVPSVVAVLGHQLELLGADLLDDALVYCLALLGAELQGAGDGRLVAAGNELRRLTGG